ncbi:hypothetical protein LKO27_12360 [Tessaracoccus sp. OS52]|uniref:hypothetical protein n=1 Tax=Tessaracoccus sp. OS52 TaxID=2886691 RepID=UPI001D10B294|nr:hypothetical protein [Tessaracoccus sp. OS52]MCC2594200.1 hypothetical protein [Tessaracoccus sp. OS52]
MKCTTIAALILSLGALTACTAEADSAPPPTPSVTGRGPVPGDTPAPTRETTLPQSPTPSPSPAPSPSPSPSETLDADQLAAREVVNEYFRLLNELRKDPELPVQLLANITVGQTQDLDVRAIVDLRTKGAIQEGDIVWTILEVTRASDRGEGRVVVLQACTDNSGSDVINQATRESILPADRPNFIHWTIDAVTENGVWKVGDLTNTEVESCSVG